MMNATIGEIQKAIEDDFNENVRRARRHKQPQPRVVVQPQTRLLQKRRTVRISDKWTKPTKTRLSPPPKQMDPNEAASRLNGDSSMFVFGTAAKIDGREIKHPQEEDTTVCSSDTHTLFRQSKERKRCKPTAMMRHRMWPKSNSPHDNNQRSSSLQIKGRKGRSQPANQNVHRPTDKITRRILSKNRTKKTQIAKQGLKQNVSQTKTIMPIQKKNDRTSIRDTAIISYQPMSPALRYALLRSNKRYTPGD